MSSWALGVAGYCVLLAVLLALAVAGHRPAGRVPAGGGLLLAARGSRAGRIVVVLAWWWVGWHFFVR